MIVEIDIQYNKWHDAIDNLEQYINIVASEVISYLGVDKLYSNIELSVVLSENEFVKNLNNQYRGVDKATNVLSFPGEEFDNKDFTKLVAKTSILLLGDVVFAYEIIEEECLEQNKEFKKHFSHLLVHGILHLLGFDHEEDDEAEEMEFLEQQILKKFNIDL